MTAQAVPGMPEEELPDDIKLAVRSHPGIWMDNFGWLEDREKKLRRADPANNIQRELFKIYCWCQDNNEQCNVIGLKSRKEGLSTGATALAYHHLTEHTAEGVIIGTDHETSDTLVNMLRRFAERDTFDWGTSFRYRTSVHEGSWSHGSKVSRETAMESTAKRGSTLQVLIACVPGNTLVILENGVISEVKDVTPGQRLLTHTGEMATVNAVIGKPNSKGKLVRIKPCVGGPVSFTYDHRICTRSGWKEAKDVTLDDELCMPIRRFTDGISGFRIPDQAHRPQGGGTKRAFAGEVIPLNQEIGFAIGYYLAEGHIFRRNKKTCIGVTFARHRSEAAYADRAVAALATWTVSHRRDDRKNSLTSTDTIYGVGLAELITEKFGRTDGKIIPDWVWDCGREFCLGLVIGYLSGDGSKNGSVGGKYDRIVSRSIRSSISSQIRDLVASLGLGWGYLSTRPAGSHYGRSCKACYSVDWNGPAARAIRQAMGLPILNGLGRRREAPYSLEGDRVWLKIAKIDEDEADTVWDLSVDHPEHSFRTVHFACHNTECAHWPADGKRSADDTMLSLLNSMPDVPNILRVVDSTANGATGWFYDTYQGAVTFEERKAGKRGNGWIRLFEPWHASDLRRVKLTDEQRAVVRQDLSQREQAGIALYGWSEEQIQWRRDTIATKCSGDEKKFDQEYPESEDVAFLTSGSPKFHVANTAKMLRAAENGWKSMRAGQPGGGYLGYLRGNPLIATDMPHIMPVADNAWLWVREDPKRGRKYLLFGDPMTGEQSAGATVRDRHAFGVIRDAYADEEGVHVPEIVACLHDEEGARWDMDVLADRVALLHRWYGRCIVVPEVNKAMDLIPLLRARHVTNLYHRPVRPDHDNPAERQEAVGFYTSEQTRGLWVTALTEAIRQQSFVCMYPPAIRDMLTFIVNKRGRAEAAPRKHDDWCFVAGTRVLTPNGEVPIETLNVGDLVTTRNGSRRVQHTSSRLRPVIQNLGLVGTEDHPVITPNGEIELSILNDEDILYIWNSLKQTVEKRSFTTAKDTTDTLCRSTGSFASIFGGITKTTDALWRCIDRFGLMLTERFQRAMSSITKTATRSITRLETWRSCFAPITLGCTPLSQSACASVPRTVSGAFLLSAPDSQGGRQDSLPENYGSATSPLQSSPFACLSMIVRALAVALFFGLCGSALSIVLRVAMYGSKIALLAQRRRVYNIQVEDSPEYFANGILVHNCAGIGIGILALPSATLYAELKPKAAPRPLVSGSGQPGLNRFGACG